MKAICTDKHARMLGREVSKLTKLVGPMLVHYGFVMDGEGRYHRTRTIDERTTLSVWPIMDDDGHPWLACCWDRPDPRPDLRWDDRANAHKYRDLPGVVGPYYNPKVNCHIFERMTAEEAMQVFESHIRRLLMEYQSAWLY